MQRIVAESSLSKDQASRLSAEADEAPLASEK